MVQFSLSKELLHSNVMLIKCIFHFTNHYLPVNWLWGKAIKMERVFKRQEKEVSEKRNNYPRVQELLSPQSMKILVLY
jgi:hypothetical protein